ncbi:TetR/AcrR family transcriptional regulator [Alteromonas sp. ALT199]|uniref:TetR/AcrR family transcriptional regulator n=1 Tax=unclassified Alteromonas TaxID=2614992 RepID=UPI0004499B4E|nr:TetR/AcrR family transcriptional regulator [Alteromonas sp. ALT199]MBT3136564.1 TetR/AcrR family transcriptional regulator [Alteromonas sp. ALT199]
MKYDHNDIIEKATTLFWQRGFQAAGMRDIQQALDMRPGSIYARFQSKEGLFKLVVEHYAENSAKRLKQVTEAASPIDALYNFFETALTGPDEQRYMRQCLLIKSIAELDIIGDIARKAVLQSMQTLKAGFKNIVEACIKKGELPENTPTTLAAEWLQNQFVGLRAFALMQDENKATIQMIDKVMIDLKGQWPQKAH